jgi:hypothetical protein
MESYCKQGNYKLKELENIVSALKKKTKSSQFFSGILLSNFPINNVYNKRYRLSFYRT